MRLSVIFPTRAGRFWRRTSHPATLARPWLLELPEPRLRRNGRSRQHQPDALGQVALDPTGQPIDVAGLGEDGVDLGPRERAAGDAGGLGDDRSGHVFLRRALTAVTAPPDVRGVGQKA